MVSSESKPVIAAVVDEPKKKKKAKPAPAPPAPAPPAPTLPAPNPPAQIKPVRAAHSKKVISQPAPAPAPAPNSPPHTPTPHHSHKVLPRDNPIAPTANIADNPLASTKPVNTIAVHTKAKKAKQVPTDDRIDTKEEPVKKISKKKEPAENEKKDEVEKKIPTEVEKKNKKKKPEKKEEVNDIPPVELKTPPVTGALLTSIPHGSYKKPGYVQVVKPAPKTVKLVPAVQVDVEEDGNGENEDANADANEETNETASTENRPEPAHPRLEHLSNGGKAVGKQVRADIAQVQTAYKGFFPTPEELPRPIRPLPTCVGY